MKKIISILILLIFTSPLCFAKGGEHKGHLKKIFKQLDLSKEQKQSLKKLREEKSADMKGLRQQKKALRDSMSEAMMSDASDDQLRSLHKEVHSKMANIQSQIKTNRFEKILKIRSVLSPAQRKTFFEMKKKMKMKKRHRHDY